jgi:hypothetical protein
MSGIIPTTISVPGGSGTIVTMSQGQQTMANSHSWVPASDYLGLPVFQNGAMIPVTVANSHATYTAGYVMGGKTTVANILPPTFSGTLQSLTLTFSDTVQSVEMDVALFKSTPAGTFNDNAAPVIASADSALLLGVSVIISNLFDDFNLDHLTPQFETTISAMITSISVIFTEKFIVHLTIALRLNSTLPSRCFLQLSWSAARLV